MFELVAAFLLLAAEPAAAPEPQPAPPAPAVAPTEGATAPGTGAAAPEAEAPPPAAATQPEKPAVEPVAAPAAAAAPATPATEAAEAAEPVDPSAPVRVTASLGIGRSWPGGLVDSNAPMNDLTSSMAGVRLDFGVRITQRWMAAIVVDAMGGGNPGLLFRGLCGSQECTTSSTRTSLEGRYVFSPTAKKTWWAGAGLGGESTRVSLKDSKKTLPSLPTYSGGIFPRLSGGWDWRVNRYFGWGFYGALSSGRYTKVSFGDSKDTQDLAGDPRGHSWLDLGVRIILFP
jgi:hypothetical protein